MLRRLPVLVFLVAGLPGVRAQEPPPQGFDADAVVEEIHAFYADYWKAWEEGDLEGVAAGLAPEFSGYLYAAPQGVVRWDKEAVLAGVRQFFDAVRDRETLWSHNLLTVVPRSASEAVAAVRNDFSLYEAGGEVEVTLEVLRKEPAGRWRLVRKWSEKRPF